MYNGIINIYKEAGFTSHDVVAKLRGILGQKKIGHTGTLDPEAVGVLPVCLGKGTKVCDLLTDKDKTYEAVIRFGIVTDTQDMTGQVLRSCDACVEEEALLGAMAQFKGEYEQIPPMYSALKVGGKKLYELAREGKTVERKARKVYIHELTLLSMAEDGKSALMRVHCSKGTYIRTLCEDIGEILGCGACMEKLTRTEVGVFKIEDALTLDQVSEITKAGEADSVIRAVDSLFTAWPAVMVKKDAEKFLFNGNPMKKTCLVMTKESADLSMSEAIRDGQSVRVYDSEGRFCAVYRYDGQRSMFKNEKMFI